MSLIHGKYEDSYLRKNLNYNLPWEEFSEEEKDAVVLHAQRLYDELAREDRAPSVTTVDPRFRTPVIGDRALRDRHMRADAWQRAISFALDAARVLRNFDPLSEPAPRHSNYDATPVRPWSEETAAIQRGNIP